MSDTPVVEAAFVPDEAGVVVVEVKPRGPLKRYIVANDSNQRVNLIEWDREPVDWPSVIDDGTHLVLESEFVYSPDSENGL